MILAAGQQLLAEVGFARFSAREVAKRIGYSVGTVANLFGGIDGLVSALNARTFALWAEGIEALLNDSEGVDRIATLAKGYFDFATENHNLWSAIYEHRLPAGAEMPAALARERAALTAIIAREVAAVLPADRRCDAPTLSRSLIATVHGHCTFALNGSFSVMGEDDPLGLATDRIREVLRAHGAGI